MSLLLKLLGGGSAALSGNAAVAGRGTLAPVVTVALTGNAAVAGRGTLAPVSARALTGNAAVAGRGSLTPASTIPLSGNAAVAGRGTLTPVDSPSGAAGQSAIATQGTLAPGVTVPLTGVSATAATGTLIGVILSKSGVNRLWLIDYYTKEWAKKELPIVSEEFALTLATPATKRKATIAAKKQVAASVAKAEADLDNLAQGFKSAIAAQQFTAQLLAYAQQVPQPETDFMAIADGYRKKRNAEDDELLLLSMVI